MMPPGLLPTCCDGGSAIKLLPSPGPETVPIKTHGRVVTWLSIQCDTCHHIACVNALWLGKYPNCGQGNPCPGKYVVLAERQTYELSDAPRNY